MTTFDEILRNKLVGFCCRENEYVILKASQKLFCDAFTDHVFVLNANHLAP